MALVVTDELWTVGERAAKRLVELGRAGVGGFVAAPRSADGMIARRAGVSLDVWLAANPGPVAWQRALAMIASLAGAAQVCEQQSLFPGAITTDQLVVRADALELRADPLVHAIAGKPVGEARPPRWLPPEAQRPDNASNRYAIWVHLRITDARGRLVYEAGRVDRPDHDLRDKRFLRVTTRDPGRDRLGRPLGMFGADIADGPDVPRWTALGDAAFRGRGLVNFQNGFLRCVSCIGTIDQHGQCQAAPGQGSHRADRYSDGSYDQDTGECRSNLHGKAALLETCFPVGALDASRGLLKGPDAIIDTRSLAPNRPARYIHDLDAPGSVGPYTVEATLEFRAFPPYLIRAFIDYEAA